tara:strand:- start:231 stop:368 length:138 start_codon:yes stop_codon:yes gene_type:complete
MAASFARVARQAIPIGIVYATWAGLGVFLIAILGKAFLMKTRLSM